jgi:hypothetical protein
MEGFRRNFLVYQEKKLLKSPAAQQMMTVLRAEKDIWLRIDLLEGQSSSIAQMLAKAIWEQNEAAFAEYSKRLAANRGRVEELLWVLGEKTTTSAAGQSVLDLQVASKKNNTVMPVREVIEKLRAGELKMDDLSAHTQTMVRKGALEMKNANRA